MSLAGRRCGCSQDATSLITRLRAEAQASERNHAMRTAMLATCEAQVAQLQKVWWTCTCRDRVAVCHVMYRNVIMRACVSQEAADREESVAASASAAGALKAELEALQVCVCVNVIVLVTLSIPLCMCVCVHVGVV